VPWVLLLCLFALLHALHLRADFPNHTQWFMDWAKYTDEGWYGNAAVRAHLFGNWYMSGDFNPGPAVPVWPFLEWLLFFFTGVTVHAARALAVFFFFVNLLLSYLLLRARGSRWMALLALTLLVTSPFLYCFSRLAILEPLLTALTLAALNLAVRLPRLRFPVLSSVAIGLLFTMMMLTKTTAIFLLPALGWAMVAGFWPQLKLSLRCALTAAATFAVSFGAWIGMLASTGLLRDYKYFFFINKYDKPPEFYWPLLSFWWSFHGGLWIDRILIPLAGIVTLAALVAAAVTAGRSRRGRELLLNPLFGASVLAVTGYIFFMTYQNHPQPRYFAVVAFFSFFIVAMGAEALLGRTTPEGEASPANEANATASASHKFSPRMLGWAFLAMVAVAVAINAGQTLTYVRHPEYTFVDAAKRLTRFIDEHPNGKRLLVSISGDQITMVTHLPTLCDDFGTEELVKKLDHYQPGWYAAWNDLDPGTLEDLHHRYWLEQVASFRAFDDPERNVLVLFKLHPLSGGRERDASEQNLKIKLPGDKIRIPIE